MKRCPCCKKMHAPTHFACHSGSLGGLASAAALTKAQRKARASKAGKLGGWPKGKPRKGL